MKTPNVSTKRTTLGSRIAGIRRTRKINAKDFAAWLKITPKHLSEIENEKTSPSVELLEKIVRGLDTSADYLLLGEIKGRP